MSWFDAREPDNDFGTDNMRVAVVGAGAVGGYFEARVAPLPTADRPVLPVPYTAPRDLTNRPWRDLDGGMGGDSLRATQILGRPVKSFGIELSVTDLIRAETIAQMAELTTMRNAAGSGNPS